MFRFARRAERLTDVHFCDSCAKVTTFADRSRRHHDRVRVQALMLPR